jgi:hypothetical protein
MVSMSSESLCALGIHDLSGLSQASLAVLPAPASCKAYRCLVFTLRMWKGDVLRFMLSSGSARVSFARPLLFDALFVCRDLCG